MPRLALPILRVALLVSLVPRGATAQTERAFTLEQVLGYPYPSELVAAPNGAAIAWVLDERGERNVWAAGAPDWAPHRLTSYLTDDGQELSQLAFTPDRTAVIYVRGGDHDANWPAEGNLPPDPSSSPMRPKVEIWAAAVSGAGAPRLLAEGDEPAVSPRGDRVAFVRDGQLWAVALDGAKPPAQLFFTRGTNSGLAWSPDGSTLAFVSDRGDHSFIGLFTRDSTPIRYIAPATTRDFTVRWSPDGRRIAFIRMPGIGGPPRSRLELEPEPWAIWVADVSTGAAHEVWQSPKTLHGSYPETAGETNLAWAGEDRLAFLADLDGWPHLYSVALTGGAPLLLTPGPFMVEHVAVTPDHRTLIYSANTGSDSNDVDRRHLFRVSVDRAAPSELTSSDGLEWTPVVTGDGQTIAFLSADARRPPVPAVMPEGGGPPKLLGADRIPADFPSTSFVVPQKVIWHAPDGLAIHGQLFLRPGISGRRPGIVFVHGGPPRQMLLGWHYMDYYSNAYAVNQYLASRGYVVLTVNYRLGIGYGHDFHHPPHAGPAGAAEYQDVLAGARYLASRADVDPRRIGIWGGSYGGYLTALALGRNSDVFATGVDLHGVHDWGRFRTRPPEWRYDQGDLDSARAVSWRSSPVSAIETWKSPVLLIHGDDDRNVRFAQTVDLVQRLDAAHVRHTDLVLPDEIHGFLRYRSWVSADSATAAWFGAMFGMR